MSSTTSYVSDSTATRQQKRVSAAQAGLRLGERLRQLRAAAGMTQTDLAGEVRQLQDTQSLMLGI